MDAAASIFWDKRAMLLAPGDISKAVVTHWLENPATHVPRGLIRAQKKPLESRVWYLYKDQDHSHGDDGRLEKVGRLMDGTGGPQIWNYTHNVLGRPCSVIDPMGRETRYTWGTSVTSDPVCTTGSGIDLMKVEQKTGPSTWDVVETAFSNDKHLPLSITDGAGQTTTYAYNGAGQIATITTPFRPAFPGEQRITTFTYEQGTGYLQQVVAPGPVNRSYTYDAYGRIRTVTNNDNDVMTYDYDLFDRPTRTTYPDGSYEEVTYDRLDAQEFRDRLGRVSETLHDPLGRVVSTRDPENRVITRDWCICGSLNRLVDANGNATTWERDLQGRVQKEIRANGSSRTYTYETNTSRVKQVTDAKGQTIQYSYALDDRLTLTDYINPQQPTPDVTLSYNDPTTGQLDPHGRIRKMTDGTGDTIYTYYPYSQAPAQLGAGELQSVDGPMAGTTDRIDYAYDELGRVISRTFDGVASGWVYDQQWRLDAQTDPVGTFDYIYDGTSTRLVTLTYPNNQSSTYTYFGAADDRRLQQMQHKGPFGALLNAFTYTYDDIGNILTWSQQNGAGPQLVRRFYLESDRTDQLEAATLKNYNDTQTLKRYRYFYDAAGNRTGEEIDNSVSGSTYDNMNRLVSQQAGGPILFRGTTNEPAYVTVQSNPATTDANNQFTGTAQVGSGPTNVVVQATDYSNNVATKNYQVNQSGASRSFTYDANGNLASKTEGGVTTTYDWDAENRLVAVRQGPNTLAIFTYDGRGRRSIKLAGAINVTYIWDGDQVIQERSPYTVNRRYIDGTAIDQHLAMVDGPPGSIVSYFVSDHLGSIVRTTNSSGGAILTREFDPWGNLLQGATTSGYAFTGREWDAEINLYYYRARYYSPSVGRFASQDRLGLTGPLLSSGILVGEATLNLYTYTSGNPIAFTDPLGLSRTPSFTPPPLPTPPCANPPPQPRGPCIQFACKEEVYSKAKPGQTGNPNKCVVLVQFVTCERRTYPPGGVGSCDGIDPQIPWCSSRRPWKRTLPPFGPCQPPGNCPTWIPTCQPTPDCIT